MIFHAWAEFVQTDTGEFAALILITSRRGALKDGMVLPSRFADDRVERTDALYDSTSPTLRRVRDEAGGRCDDRARILDGGAPVPPGAARRRYADIVAVSVWQGCCTRSSHSGRNLRDAGAIAARVVGQGSPARRRFHERG